jgi:hypothetical protein
MTNARTASGQSNKTLIAEFQRSLGDTVVLLLELKTKPALTRVERKAVDDLVEELQEIIREIPAIGDSSNCFQLVFTTIRRVWDFWHHLFG